MRRFRGEQLSYFSATPYSIGSIINVPLRNKQAPALVFKSSNVEHVRSQIRTAAFATKKISKNQKPLLLFHPRFIHAIEETALFFAASVGSVLATLTPTAILEKREELSHTDAFVQSDKTTTIEKLVFQAERIERFDRYRSITREEFARNKSVFLLVPTIEDAERAFELLSRGVGRYTVLLHGSLTKKQQQDRWRQVLDTSHPLLIIGTGLFLSLPREDLKSIIIEREYAQNYYTQQRPHLDIRIAAEYIAQQLGARIIFAGMPLRIETLYRYHLHEFDELAPLKTRVPAHTSSEVIDMRTRREHTKKREFIVLAKELREQIENLSKTKERMFLYTARRGIAPITICEDCGNVVACSECHAAVVLHKGQRENVFVCHACGATRSARERCKHCSSWKLTALGIGIERVQEEFKRYFPNQELFLIDRDSTKTHNQAKKVAEKFYDTPGAVLLGTQMALSYLGDTIERIAVVSLDSLLSLPDWNAHERVFVLLTLLRNISTKTLTVQTRQPEAAVLSYALSGNISDFYRNEITERKQFGYPPFSVLIKITIESTRTKIIKEMFVLEKLFSKYQFMSYTPPLHIGHNRYVQHGLIRLSKERKSDRQLLWPDKRLVTQIRALPPHITVSVAPEHLM